MEVMAQDSGFVFDEASGLYFHASSGFYHDANAGWYYNTNDGGYYMFDEGTYVPIAATVNSGIAVPETKISQKDLNSRSTNVDEKEQGMLNSQGSEVSKSATEVSPDTSLALRSPEGCDVSQGATPIGTGSYPQADIASLEIGFPLWHYDSLRSIYWYYDKVSRAYYKYNEEAHYLSKATEIDGKSTTKTELFQQEPTVMKEVALGNVEVSDTAAGRFLLQETSQHREDEDNFEPTSGWVEEALIDLYLKGYPSDPTEMDPGPLITSADIFSDGSSTGPPLAAPGYCEPSYNESGLMANDQPSCVDLIYDAIVEQASINESDNEGSEELEEGEWVPVGPLHIVDEGQAYMHHVGNMDREKWESMQSAALNDDNGGHNEDLEEGEVEERVTQQDEDDAMSDYRSEVFTGGQENVDLDDGQRMEEEQWQAQFGQVVREKARGYAIPGAVDLWDWMILEMEPKALKPGKVVMKLVGRIVSSVTKLVSASSGLIRTSAICATELDFVKVSSGKIYRLRRPSAKHMNSLGMYDSSNPTKDWGFPVIGLSLLDTLGDSSLNNGNGDPDQTERQTDTLVSKPFVPNIGHWQFQRLVSTNTKKRRGGVPAALLASKYLSPEEILINELRSQKYRDRAAERRTLHGGFGTGPGQKGLTPREEEQVDADNAVEMEGALKNAVLAPPLGRNNVGMRMLEGMGWKEGSTLGVGGGLSSPLQARGNVGRAGLGWS